MRADGQAELVVVRLGHVQAGGKLGAAGLGGKEFVVAEFVIALGVRSDRRAQLVRQQLRAEADAEHRNFGLQAAAHETHLVAQEGVAVGLRHPLRAAMDDEAGQIVEARRQRLAGERRAPCELEAAGGEVGRGAVVVGGVVVLDEQDLAGHDERLGQGPAAMLEKRLSKCKMDSRELHGIGTLR